MVKVYTSSHSYDYPFPAVTLAYFLRYPNPYSTHVLSTDVISRHFDPATQRLSTTRLHLKQSKLPPGVLRLLPKNILSGNKGSSGEAQNFILEKSIIDVREGWMETETQNLQYTGVLTVLERQRYTQPRGDQQHQQELDSGGAELIKSSCPVAKTGTTDVTTTVTFLSRLGQQKALGKPRGKASASEMEDDGAQKKGFFSTWSTAALQRTIEATGMQKTRNALLKSKEGMNVVLERMRTGGLAAAIEGMRRDRELVGGGSNQRGDQQWRKVWQDGGAGERSEND